MMKELRLSIYILLVMLARNVGSFSRTGRFLFEDQTPTSIPSNQPSQHPSTQPSNQPSQHPSTQPTKQPSMKPSLISQSGHCPEGSGSDTSGHCKPCPPGFYNNGTFLRCHPCSEHLSSGTGYTSCVSLSRTCPGGQYFLSTCVCEGDDCNRCCNFCPKNTFCGPGQCLDSCTACPDGSVSSGLIYAFGRFQGPMSCTALSISAPAPICHSGTSMVPRMSGCYNNWTIPTFSPTFLPMSTTIRPTSSSSSSSSDSNAKIYVSFNVILSLSNVVQSTCDHLDTVAEQIIIGTIAQSSSQNILNSYVKLFSSHCNTVSASVAEFGQVKKPNIHSMATSTKKSLYIVSSLTIPLIGPPYVPSPDALYSLLVKNLTDTIRITKHIQEISLKMMYKNFSNAICDKSSVTNLVLINGPTTKPTLSPSPSFFTQTVVLAIIATGGFVIAVCSFSCLYLCRSIIFLRASKDSKMPSSEKVFHSNNKLDKDISERSTTKMTEKRPELDDPSIKLGPQKYIQLFNLDKKSFYLNMETGYACWSLNSTQLAQSLINGEEGGLQYRSHPSSDYEGYFYYENVRTSEVTWSPPVEVMSIAAKQVMELLVKLCDQDCDEYITNQEDPVLNDNGHDIFYDDNQNIEKNDEESLGNIDIENGGPLTSGIESIKKNSGSSWIIRVLGSISGSNFFDRSTTPSQDIVTSGSSNNKYNCDGGDDSHGESEEESSPQSDRGLKNQERQDNAKYAMDVNGDEKYESTEVNKVGVKSLWSTLFKTTTKSDSMITTSNADGMKGQVKSTVNSPLNFTEYDSSDGSYSDDDTVDATSPRSVGSGKTGSSGRRSRKRLDSATTSQSAQSEIEEDFNYGFYDKDKETISYSSNPLHKLNSASGGSKSNSSTHKASEISSPSLSGGARITAHIQSSSSIQNPLVRGNASPLSPRISKHIATPVANSSNSNPTGPYIDPSANEPENKMVKYKRMMQTHSDAAVRQCMKVDGFSDLEIYTFLSCADIMDDNTNDFSYGSSSNPKSTVPSSPVLTPASLSPGFESSISSLSSDKPAVKIQSDSTPRPPPPKPTAETPPPPPKPKAPVSAIAENDAVKYKKMLNMLPEGAVKQKMKTDGYSENDINIFIKNQSSTNESSIGAGTSTTTKTTPTPRPPPPKPTAGTPPPPPKPKVPVSAIAENDAVKYKKMLNMLPEGAVKQKMRVDGYSENDISIFITNENN